MTKEELKIAIDQKKNQLAGQNRILNKEGVPENIKATVTLAIPKIEADIAKLERELEGMEEKPQPKPVEKKKIIQKAKKEIDKKKPEPKKETKPAEKKKIIKKAKAVLDKKESKKTIVKKKIVKKQAVVKKKIIKKQAVGRPPAIKKKVIAPKYTKKEVEDCKKVIEQANYNVTTKTTTTGKKITKREQRTDAPILREKTKSIFTTITKDVDGNKEKKKEFSEAMKIIEEMKTLMEKVFKAMNALLAGNDIKKLRVIRDAFKKLVD